MLGWFESTHSHQEPIRRNPEKSVKPGRTKGFGLLSVQMSPGRSTAIQWNATVDSTVADPTTSGATVMPLTDIAIRSAKPANKP